MKTRRPTGTKDAEKRLSHSSLTLAIRTIFLAPALIHLR